MLKYVQESLRLWAQKAHTCLKVKSVSKSKIERSYFTSAKSEVRSERAPLKFSSRRILLLALARKDSTMDITNNVMKLEGARNWNIWKFQMTVLMRGQGWLDIVEGRTVKPEDATERTIWESKDAKAQTLLLKQLGEEISDKFAITKVLHKSAPEDKQTFDNLVTRLLIEEERLKEKTEEKDSTPSSSAFVARRNIKCFKCGKSGHYQTECRSNKDSEKKETKKVSEITEDKETQSNSDTLTTLEDVSTGESESYSEYEPCDDELSEVEETTVQNERRKRNICGLCRYATA
ncbi:hypothetical protein SFRURICE_009385 [Spodoptera frugiperda]|nr:hypothetical protein SFRURICE_009385 [Spodoptera frugiperda]